MNRVSDFNPVGLVVCGVVGRGCTYSDYHLRKEGNCISSSRWCSLFSVRYSIDIVRLTISKRDFGDGTPQYFVRKELRVYVTPGPYLMSHVDLILSSRDLVLTTFHSHV